MAAYSIDIPGGPLAQSLRTLAVRTGVSVGFAGSLPNVRTKPVHGARSAAEALSQMLAGSGYRAMATGPSSFRIERIAQPARQKAANASAQDEIEGAQIVVTALKRRALLFSIPATIDVVQPDQLQSAAGISGNDILDRELPALSTSDVGAGRNRLFLRGIGDGPLGGFNQGSVAILMDEARLNYDAPDPGWALVDIDRVEVLEGPQGPLYGTGAIGGIVKVVTRQPDLSASSLSVGGGLATTQDGDQTNSQNMILNLPIADGKGAARAVVYRLDRAGWIDNAGDGDDSNRERLLGARLGLKIAPGRWVFNLNAGFQSRSAEDSQYVDGDLGSLERPSRLKEPRDVDATLAMMTVTGPVAGLELTSVTSFSKQEAVADFDATPLAPILGTSGTTRVTDNRRYTLFDQELRIRNPNARSFDWIAGASLIKASTIAVIRAQGADEGVTLLYFNRSVTEAALFGEANLTVSSRLTLSGGGRLFSSRVEDEASSGPYESLDAKSKIREAMSAAANWKAAPWATVFLRASTAFRPGGINVQPDATQSAYEADELASIELGAHIAIDRTFSLSTTAFVAQWKHVQADELLANGLVATRNAGDAVNFGMEGKLSWLPTASTAVDVGFLFQSSKLQNEEPGASIDDRRLPVVPEAAVRVRLSQGFKLGDWKGGSSLGLNYTGATHLSFDPTLDQRTRGHATLDASVTMSKGPWKIELIADNLGNSTADTFAFGNPYRIRSDAQRTPEQPRVIGLTVNRAF